MNKAFMRLPMFCEVGGENASRDIDNVLILGSRIWERCFKRDVGIASKSQLVSGDWEKTLETSSAVAQVKDDKLGGVDRGGKWGEAELRLIRRLVWSLWILLQKKLANDWDNRILPYLMGCRRHKSAGHRHIGEVGASVVRRLSAGLLCAEERG